MKINLKKLIKILVFCILIFGILGISACETTSDGENKNIPAMNNNNLKEINFSFNAYSFRDYSIVGSLNDVIFYDTNNLKEYFVENSILNAVDGEGNYNDTELGKMLEQYNEEYFSNSILCLITTAHTPFNYVYKIKNVYLGDNKIYVIRENVPSNFTHVQMPGGFLYFVEIKREEFKEITLTDLEIGGYYKESDWNKQE